MQQRRDQLAAGATEAEAAHNLEQTIRACWPFTRVWHYLCDSCQDTGYRIWTCDGTRDCGCQKSFTAHYPHEFVEPCHCANGDRKRLKPAPETALATVGKVSRKMTRFGQ